MNGEHCFLCPSNRNLGNCLQNCCHNKLFNRKRFFSRNVSVATRRISSTCSLYQFILSVLVSLSCKIYQLQTLLVLLDLIIIMEDITTFFRNSSKKKDVSNTSKTDEDPKKIRESRCTSFTDEGDVFNEGIDSSGWGEILFNCLKNFEGKVMETYEQKNENKNMYIKGEKQLVDLAESVTFMTSKFDELEKDRKGKEKIINNLKGEVNCVSEKLGKLGESIEFQQQYSRRSCLLLHGIEETKGKTLATLS